MQRGTEKRRGGGRDGHAILDPQLLVDSLGGWASREHFRSPRQLCRLRATCPAETLGHYSPPTVTHSSLHPAAQHITYSHSVL